MPKVAYQGMPGSFSYIASKNYFGKNNDFVGVKYFKDIFDILDSGKADYGVIPIENSLAGSIYENYDFLNKYKQTIVGEYYLGVKHNLLGLKNSKLKNTKEAYSHQKALEQCQRFFQNYPKIEQKVYFDTASSAKYVKELGSDAKAAIASAEAARIYGLKVLLKNIEDNKNNYTRFLIISKNANRIADINKCSFAFTLAHVSGSLVNSLKIFAENRINLTKIESRPIHGKIFEYIFYADIEFNNKNYQKIKKILNLFKRKTRGFKILGFYKAAVIGKKSL